MLKSTVFCFGAIGILYGCLLLENSDGTGTLYLVGRWDFRSTKSRLRYCVAFIVLVTPSIVLFLVIPTMVGPNMAAYFSKILSMIWAGMCLSFALPTVLNRFDWIVYSCDSQLD